MKNDAGKLVNKIEVYGDIDDTTLTFLADKLENLVSCIDKQLEDKMIQC